jgi:hypothetical protein
VRQRGAKLERLRMNERERGVTDFLIMEKKKKKKKV